MSQLACKHCEAVFASKTKLFAHLRASTCTAAAVAAGLKTKDTFEKVALIIGSSATDKTWQNDLWKAIDHARGVGKVPDRESYAEKCGAPGASFASDARGLEVLQQEADMLRICDVLSFSTEVVDGEEERTKWCDAANAVLRSDVRILGRSAALPVEFHANGSCLRRYYECLMPIELLVPALKSKSNVPNDDLQQSVAQCLCTDDEPDDVLNEPSLPQASKQNSSHVSRGSGDPRWGEGVDREACLTEFQRLKTVLRRFQGEHRFHNLAPTLKLVPTESASRRFIYKLRAGTEIGQGMCTLSVAADAMLVGQLRAMAALSVAVQRRLLPDEYVDMVLGDQLVPPIPAIPSSSQYLSSCVYSKQFHWLLQPLMDGPAAQAWRAQVQSEMIKSVSCTSMFTHWYEMELLPAIPSACSELARWQKIQERVVGKDVSAIALAPVAIGAEEEVPPEYMEVLKLLQEIDSSGKWPSISKGREKVIKDSTLSENGGKGGSFTLGSMPPPNEDPHANNLFPLLMRRVFELEKVLLPERLPSSTIAVNKHAQFLPHVDSGAGAGQGISLIVGLGNYTGGELVVEGTAHDIRYKPLQFNGWTQRHWTLPFDGERFSLVWFTPKGCEDMPGLLKSSDISPSCQKHAPVVPDSSSFLLRSGLELPMLGFGTYCLAKDSIGSAVIHALEAGFRLIDTGSIYKNEEMVGFAIRQWANNDEARRASVRVTSKCSAYEMGYDAALSACEASLQRLGVDSIDLYLIHSPAVAKRKHSSEVHRQARHETWRALEELYRSGRVRAIGVSNFTVAHLEQLLEDGVDIVPMVNQIEVHPLHVPVDVIEYGRAHGIFTQAYSPLGGGPHSNSAKASDGELNGTRLLLEQVAVKEIAAETGRSAAQVLLRWGIEKGFGVLPQSSCREHIVDNAGIFDFSLSAEQVARLSAFASDGSISRKFCWDLSSVS